MRFEVRLAAWDALRCDVGRSRADADDDDDDNVERK